MASGGENMEKKLVEYINDCDNMIIGIGNEWNWIESGIKEDSRYRKLIEYAGHDNNEWLIPVIEFEYGYYNNNELIDKAYKKLRHLVGDKNYYLVCDTFLEDAVLNGFDRDKCVFPCGNFRYLQTSDPTDKLIEANKSEEFLSLVDRIHGIITDNNGLLEGNETFNLPFFQGKSLYLNQKRKEYSKINYNESIYLDNWDRYMKYLTSTIGNKLLILELGVSLDYPTVIRWPFEKVAFINNKAHLIRVHERLYQHTPEIKDKTDSVHMNSVNYILQESEGL